MSSLIPFRSQTFVRSLPNATLCFAVLAVTSLSFNVRCSGECTNLSTICGFCPFIVMVGSLYGCPGVLPQSFCADCKVKAVTCLWHAIHSLLHLSRVMRKSVFGICENKDADQLRGKVFSIILDTCLRAIMKFPHHGHESGWLPNCVTIFQSTPRLTVSNALVRSTKVMKRSTFYSWHFS